MIALGKKETVKTVSVSAGKAPLEQTSFVAQT